MYNNTQMAHGFNLFVYLFFGQNLANVFLKP